MSANRSPAGKALRTSRMRSARRARLSAALALAAALLALALGITTSTALSAAASPLSTLIPTDTPTPTATATATPPSSGTITLVSPSYGKGPAGAHVTVSGSGFSGSSVSLFAASHASCSDTQAPLGSYPLSGGAFANQTFVWPALAPGTYFICGPGLSGTPPSYQQLSAVAPSISLSAPRVPAGSSLTISGSNFVGLPAGTPILVLAQQNSTTINLPAAVLDDSGSFTEPWQEVDASLNGLVTIKAFSSPEGSAPAVLQASAVVTVLPPATATPITTVTPTATVAAGTGQTSTSRGNSSGGGGVLLLLGLLALIVLTGVGVGAFLLLRGRAGPSAPKGYPDYPGYPGGQGSYGGFGQTGGYPGVGASGTTGRMASAGYPAPYGRSGEYEAGGYGGAGVGAVSQWDELPSEPGPGWQPRPMTGYGRLDLPPDDGGAAPGWQPSGAPPDDPWAEPPYGGAQGGYSGEPGYAGGQRYSGGAQSGWGSFGEEDGSGTTRPGYGGQSYGQDPYGQPGSRGTGRYPRPDRRPDDYDDAGDGGPWPDPRSGGGGGGGQGW